MTGGSGFIGSHIVVRLVFDGHDVVVIDNESATVTIISITMTKQILQYDICDLQKKNLFDGVDFVYHCVTSENQTNRLNVSHDKHKCKWYAECFEASKGLMFVNLFFYIIVLRIYGHV